MYIFILYYIIFAKRHYVFMYTTEGHPDVHMLTFAATLHLCVTNCYRLSIFLMHKLNSRCITGMQNHGNRRPKKHRVQGVTGTNPENVFIPLQYVYTTSFRYYAHTFACFRTCRFLYPAPPGCKGFRQSQVLTL